jgi:hypothetical protein
MGKYKAYAESAHTISPHLQNTIFMCAVFGDFPQTHMLMLKVGQDFSCEKT